MDYDYGGASILFLSFSQSDSVSVSVWGILEVGVESMRTVWLKERVK